MECTSSVAYDLRTDGTVHSREAGFWDARVPDLESCLREVEAGPDPNTALALELLGPLDGRRVLELGCGTGVVSAWLAAAGARVTALDLSEASIQRARELHAALGHSTRFVAGSASPVSVEGEAFEHLVGRYVLHHLDPPAVATQLAALLEPDGTGAFVETMGTNPLLRFARRRVTGRLGIPSYGSADERPLDAGDLASLDDAFGELDLRVRQVHFLRLLDRQVLHYRWRMLSSVCGLGDDVLGRAGLGAWSYHQVVFVRKARRT